MSAEIVASNEDLLIIILSKLPARSLLQFRSVSRQWHDVISSSRFAFLHFNPSAISGFFFNRMCFGCPKRGAGGQFIPLRVDSVAVKPPLKKLLHISPEIKILHSCNGLLLCGDTWFDSWNATQSLYLYNPTLGWYIQIPSSEGMKRDLPYGYFHEHHWTLAFDPLKSSSYKIMYLFSSEYESNRCHYSIEIYSSETGLWKLVNNRILLQEVLSACPSRIREGAFHSKYPYSVLSFIHGVDQDDALIFYVAGGAVYYDINQSCCRKLCDLNTCCGDDFAIVRFRGVHVYKHIESLLTLPGCRF